LWQFFDAGNDFAEGISMSEFCLCVAYVLWMNTTRFSSTLILAQNYEDTEKVL